MSSDFQKDKKVDISRENMQCHEAAAFAKDAQRKAGIALKPGDMIYEASAGVHIYTKVTKNLLGDRTETSFVCQLNGFENVPEVMADAAFKTLMQEMMRVYGRKIPELRKT